MRNPKLKGKCHSLALSPNNPPPLNGWSCLICFCLLFVLFVFFIVSVSCFFCCCCTIHSWVFCCLSQLFPFTLYFIINARYYCCMASLLYISRVFNFANFARILNRSQNYFKFLQALLQNHCAARAHSRNYFNESSKNSYSRKIRPAKYKRCTAALYFSALSSLHPSPFGNVFTLFY